MVFIFWATAFVVFSALFLPLWAALLAFGMALHAAMYYPKRIAQLDARDMV